MENQREDIPRVSVDSLQDWQRIRENYTNAALAALDVELAASSSSSERDLLLQHLHRVRQLLSPYIRSADSALSS